MRLRGAYDRAVASWAVAARGWDADTLATPVPATPGWSVHDVLAHVTGATSDLVADEMGGAPGHAWSARHLARWVPRPVEDTVDALLADELFTKLMGDNVDPRREFIESNAKDVRFLDV